MQDLWDNLERANLHIIGSPEGEEKQKWIEIISGASLVVQWLRIHLPNARDTGSSPGLGRSHMPQSNWARVPLLSLHSRAREPHLLSPHARTTEACVPRAHAPQQEKPPQ